MPQNKWSLLRVFATEAEARVVESFLTAQGFTVEVQNAYSYGETHFGTAGGAGLRLMILSEEFENAKKVLDEV